MTFPVSFAKKLHNKGYKGKVCAKERGRVGRVLFEVEGRTRGRKEERWKRGKVRRATRGSGA